MGVRKLTTHSYEEVLERILDRGMVLDGLSFLAAVTDSEPLSVEVDRVAPDSEQVPAAVIAPPRIRDRD